jgi:hypothetical protein
VAAASNPLGDGVRVSDGALHYRTAGAVLGAMLSRRWGRIAAEAGYDTAAWTCGLLAAMLTHAAGATTPAGWWRAAPALCAMPGTGLVYTSPSPRDA